jgi:tetratricopeptide (TPR) repeat protein
MKAKSLLYVPRLSLALGRGGVSRPSEFPAATWRDSIKQSKHRLDRLSRLVQVTSAWVWNTENTEILQEITSEFPKEKWAANTLMAQLYAAGNTRELMEFLTRMYAEDPSDTRIKNNLATLYLLHKSDLEKAFQMAQEAFDSSPKDPFFTSTKRVLRASILDCVPAALSFERVSIECIRARHSPKPVGLLWFMEKSAAVALQTYAAEGGAATNACERRRKPGGEIRV